MKSVSLAVVLLCFFTLVSAAAEKPVAGKSFTVSYDPSFAGVLSDAKQIWAVYAFDFWGTTAVQRLRGEEDGSNLFTNVLAPDEGRTAAVKMVRDGALWKADIPISKTANLLSYYFTDSVRFDYNNRKTYISYVYNENGTPVRNARLQNVDFMLMAGNGYASVCDELQKETAQYPDNFIAHMVYWRFRFFSTFSPDTLQMLAAESEAYFAKLRKQFGDTALNYHVQSLNDINRILQRSLRTRFDDPDVASLRTTVNTKILTTIDAIPAKLRIFKLQQYESAARAMLMTREERDEQERKAMASYKEMMGGFVGMPAPVFTFQILDGASHSLSEFRGRYVLLDFWGTWCAPCVGEIPTLTEAYKEYEKRGLVIVSICSDAMMGKSNRDKLIEFTKKRGMTWMQVLDDASAAIHKQYDIKFWPNMFLIDREGKVVTREGLRGPELKKTLSTLSWK